MREMSTSSLGSSWLWNDHLSVFARITFTGDVNVWDGNPGFTMFVGQAMRWPSSSGRVSSSGFASNQWKWNRNRYSRDSEGCIGLNC